MWYRRISGQLRGMIGASLIISLWVMSNNIPKCIHCTEEPLDIIGTYRTDLPLNPTKLESYTNDPAFEIQTSALPSPDTPQRPVISKSKSELPKPSLPQDYLSPTEESVFCENRFGVPYLENLRDSAIQYCTTESPSELTCFHSQTIKGRVDSLCIGQNAMFDPTTAKFRLGCELGMLPDSNLPFLAPEYGTFQKYMFDTGPRVIMDAWVQLDDDVKSNEPETPKYTILVKREGGANMWHSLLEIFSLSLTMDVLQISPKPDSRPFFTSPDTSNTQVVLLDDHPDGPYIDIWSMFATRPICRLKDLPTEASFENIILPLAGGSNPLWQSNPPIEGASCQDSALLHTFSRRVLDHYNITTQHPRQGPDIIITFIDRAETRVLLNHTEYLADVRSSFPHITIQEIDFAMLTFEEQLVIVQETDILVGVHGAGLTHAMFLPPRSTIVEIIPAQVDNRAYENLASVLSHSYFSIHSSRELYSSVGADWHEQQVSLDKSLFTDILSLALKVMYNKKTRKS